MLRFFGTKSLGHVGGQIIISGNVSEVDYSVLFAVATDLVLNVDMLGLRA